MRFPMFFALALAGTAAAQGTQIPLPAYASTFSSASATRGFYFQAPIAFVIVGLRVPDEQNNGTQNVEVRRMTSAPPLFSATANDPQVFYANNVPSNQITRARSRSRLASGSACSAPVAPPRCTTRTRPATLRATCSVRRSCCSVC